MLQNITEEPVRMSQEQRLPSNEQNQTAAMLSTKDVSLKHTVPVQELMDNQTTAEHWNSSSIFPDHQTQAVQTLSRSPKAQIVNKEGERFVQQLPESPIIPISPVISKPEPQRNMHMEDKSEQRVQQN